MSVLQNFSAKFQTWNGLGAFMQSRWDDGTWGPWGPGMMHWGMGWIGGIMMIVFWIVIIAALVVLIRWLTSTERSRHPHAEGGESPLDILKKRYARGEIDKEEFEQKKKDLS